jgi:hypothetical protein
MTRGGVGAEVGVHTGDYARFLFRDARPSILYLVDRWPDDIIINGQKHINGLEAKKIVETRFADEIKEGRIKILHCESFDLGEHIVPGSLDWIYLDTSHRYPNTLRELRVMAGLLKPGGLLMGHDFDKMTGQGYCSVKRAVEEFLLESNYRMVLLTQDYPMSFGLTCCQNAIA